MKRKKKHKIPANYLPKTWDWKNFWKKSYTNWWLSQPLQFRVRWTRHCQPARQNRIRHYQKCKWTNRRDREKKNRTNNQTGRGRGPTCHGENNTWRTRRVILNTFQNARKLWQETSPENKKTIV